MTDRIGCINIAIYMALLESLVALSKLKGEVNLYAEEMEGTLKRWVRVSGGNIIAGRQSIYPPEEFYGNTPADQVILSKHFSRRWEFDINDQDQNRRLLALGVIRQFEKTF